MTATVLTVDPGKHGCGLALWEAPSVEALELLPGAPAPSLLLLRAWYGRAPWPHGQAPEDELAAWTLCAMTCAEQVLESLRGAPLAALVAERPHIRRGGHVRRSKGTGKLHEANPNHLLGLPAVACGLASALRPRLVLSYLPEGWKGVLSKVLDHGGLLRGRLTDGELERIELVPRYLAHNTLDAVSLGLHVRAVLKREWQRSRLTPNARKAPAP